MRSFGAVIVHIGDPAKNIEPFLSVLQHSSEHYGLLVAYHRANGLFRPKK